MNIPKSKLDRLMSMGLLPPIPAPNDSPIGRLIAEEIARWEAMPQAPTVEDMLAEGYVFCHKDGILDVYTKRQVCRNTLTLGKRD